MRLFGNRNIAIRNHWVAAQAGDLAPGSRILDAGAGRGQYRSLFDHCQYETQDFAMEPGTIGFYTELDYQCDITSIPVPDDSFDCVLCTEVLEHVPVPIDAISEFVRILKPGGRLLLTAPLCSFLHQEPYHFYGGYTPHWYYKHLEEAGLSVLSLERNGGFFSFFGQESARFSALLDPRRTLKSGWRWPVLTLLWAVTLPFCRLLTPGAASYLDSLGLENIATFGYHVVGVKNT